MYRRVRRDFGNLSRARRQLPFAGDDATLRKEERDHEPCHEGEKPKNEDLLTKTPRQRNMYV